MAAIGGRGTNAYTSNDVTCYTENIPSNQLKNWAKIQADRFENVVLRGFHTELETIYEEYNMYAVMDQEKVQEAAFAALFPKHPYHTPVIGWGDHLKNSTPTKPSRSSTSISASSNPTRTSRRWNSSRKIPSPPRW